MTERTEMVWISHKEDRDSGAAIQTVVRVTVINLHKVWATNTETDDIV